MILGINLSDLHNGTIFIAFILIPLNMRLIIGFKWLPHNLNLKNVTRRPVTGNIKIPAKPPYNTDLNKYNVALSSPPPPVMSHVINSKNQSLKNCAWCIWFGIFF